MKPRLLLNENVPQPSATRLRATGWDVLVIAQDYSSIDDMAVLRLASEEGRWLITVDRDYGELIFQRRLSPPPLILLLRVHPCRPQEPAEWIDNLYQADNCGKGTSASMTGRRFGDDPFWAFPRAHHIDLRRLSTRLRPQRQACERIRG